jgi:hypothetical protein
VGLFQFVVSEKKKVSPANSLYVLPAAVSSSAPNLGSHGSHCHTAFALSEACVMLFVVDVSQDSKQARNLQVSTKKLDFSWCFPSSTKMRRFTA